MSCNDNLFSEITWQLFMKKGSVKLAATGINAHKNIIIKFFELT